MTGLRALTPEAGRVARLATIMDVAEHAGVSHQTVSRVLNGHRSVRPETRTLVQASMQALSYEPSAAARTLAGARSFTLGVVSIGTPFFGPWQMLNQISAGARARGYQIEFIDVGAGESERAVGDAVRSFRRQQVAGIAIVSPRKLDNASLTPLAGDTPLLFVDAKPVDGAPYTAVDHVGGGRLGAHHLLDLGHRRIVTISGPAESEPSRLRLEGWRAVFDAVGIEPVAEIEGDWGVTCGFEAVTRLLDAHRPGAFTAVLSANDSMALGALRALHQRGLGVPDDVSVVGFDDVPESGFFEPPLTTVRQDFVRLGELCIAQLLGLIDGAPVNRTQLVELDLVVRSSTGRPATSKRP